LFKQYVVLKDGKYLTKSAWTSSLSRAHVFSKKKYAKLSADQNGGEVETVYLSFYPHKEVIDKVWTVEKTCQVNGLLVYGPYFTQKEAENMYVNIRDNQIGPLFFFTDRCYGEAVNKLGDTLAIRETRRVV
jgi:hypothetical protein